MSSKRHCKTGEATRSYNGDVYPPVQFATPGIVVLGCNIHDGMLGYIVIVDAPHYSVTGPDGAARLDGLASGEVRRRSVDTARSA